MFTTEKINDYLKQLTKQFRGIESIWLLGSRANGYHKDDSDWDLLVFADEEILSLLREDNIFFKSNVDLLVVYDGKNFEEPWESEKTGRRKRENLIDWEWKTISKDKATYVGDKNKPVHPYDAEYNALRVWP